MARALEEQQQTDNHEEHPAVGPDGEKLDDESVAGDPTALNTVGNAIEYELSAMVKNKKTHMRSQKAQKDTQVIQAWVGSEVYEEMVCKAFQGLLYINEHKDDDVCLEQVDTFPGKPVPDHYCLPQHLSWSLWWMGAY